MGSTGSNVSALQSARRSLQDVFAEGKRFMQDRDFPKAIAAFEQVIMACPCASGSRRERKSLPPKATHAICLYSQIAAAAESRDPEAVFKAARLPCTCGQKKPPQCRETSHITALDNLAACYVLYQGVRDNSKALVKAAEIIHLAPQSPVGYCRVSQILRLRAARQSPEERAVRDISLLADCIVKHGLHNVEKYGDRSHPQYETLSVIHYQLHRKDPLKVFPNEVKHMIFSHLTTSELCVCLRVSKGWLRAVRDDPRLWTTIRLGKVKSVPPKGIWAKFLSRARELIGLDVTDAEALGLSSHKQHLMLRASQNLRHLRLGYPTLRSNEPGYEFDSTYSGPYPKKLASLSLTGMVMTTRNQMLLRNLLCHAVLSLEHLDLLWMGGQIPWPKPHGLPNLRVLKLRGPNLGGSTRELPAIVHDMYAVIEATPNLEQLRLDLVRVVFPYLDSDTGPLPLHPRGWPNLRTLSIGSKVELQPDLWPPGSVPRHWPLLSEEMRVLDIRSQTGTLSREILRNRRGLTNGEIVLLEAPNLPNLEMFHCDDLIPHRELECLLSPSIESGSLRALEFTPDDPQTTPGAGRIPVEGTEWELLLSSDTVKFVGLKDYAEKSQDDYSGKSLMDFLDRFPNADTVTLRPCRPECCADQALQLLSRDGIKRVVSPWLQGVKLDEVRTLAAEKGIEILSEMSDRTPSPWSFPWPLTASGGIDWERMEPFGSYARTWPPEVGRS
ncbi:hypothetical protein VTK73DRAFT_1436 [Phialemonium thermophilum]|uniref:F-box domain-containing protein n=1 Tax=Phialemonium thermophilum TaxID=223376 RepID=A0ABR3XAC0_9PEZI